MMAGDCRRLCFTTSLLASVASKALAEPAAIDRQVRVVQGYIFGTDRDSQEVMAFEGIPYAAAPVGVLRWRAPVPPASCSETRNAGHYGARCFSPVVAANNLDADLLIAEQVDQWLSLQAKTRQPVYGYNFTYTSPYGKATSS